MKLKRYLVKILSIIIGLWPLAIFAVNFPITSTTQRLVGSKISDTQIRNGEGFSEVAQRFDLGYYPLYELNQTANPDNPQPGSVLLVPTRYILPQALSLKKSNIVINLAELRLYYYSSVQHRVYIFPVGIGKEGWMTPLGSMRIVSKIKNPVWLVPKSIRKYRDSVGQPVQQAIKSGPTDPLGYYAMRLSYTSYLIHGTDDPMGIGRRSSAGCIRMYNPDSEKLFGMVTVGTPVTIIDQPYKACMAHNKLYFEAHLPLYEQRLKLHGDIAPAYDIVAKVAKQNKLEVNREQILLFARQHLGVPRVVDTKKPVAYKFP